MYFKSPKNVTELKQQFKKLVLRYHPDRGGTDQDIIHIKNQYQILLRNLKAQEPQPETDYEKERQAEYEKADPNDMTFQDIITTLVKFPDLTIEIIADWIWLETPKTDYQQYTKLIKELKFRWSKSKKLWYWFPGIESKKKLRFSTPQEEIRAKYGSRRFKTSSSRNKPQHRK